MIHNIYRVLSGRAIPLAIATTVRHGHERGVRPVREHEQPVHRHGPDGGRLARRRRPLTAPIRLMGVSESCKPRIRSLPMGPRPRLPFNYPRDFDYPGLGGKELILLIRCLVTGRGRSGAGAVVKFDVLAVYIYKRPRVA